MPPKKGKKGRKGDISSSEGESLDPIAHLKAGKGFKAALESANEVEKVNTVPKNVKAKSSKGKKGKKGNRDQSDEEDDSLSIPLPNALKSKNLEKSTETSVSNQELKPKTKKPEMPIQINAGTSRGEKDTADPIKSDYESDEHVPLKNKGKNRKQKKKAQNNIHTSDGSEKDQNEEHSLNESQDEDMIIMEESAATEPLNYNDVPVDKNSDLTSIKNKKRNNKRGESRSTHRNEVEFKIDEYIESEHPEIVDDKETNNFPPNSSNSSTKTRKKKMKDVKYTEVADSPVIEEVQQRPEYETHIESDEFEKKLVHVNKAVSSMNIEPKMEQEEIAELQIEEKQDSVEEKQENTKKEKKTKLQRKLEDAAKAKADANAAAGVVPEPINHSTQEKNKDIKASFTEEEQIAILKAKDEKKAKKRQEKEMLEAMGDEEYYGSDHEARGKGNLETVEEETERIVAENEQRTGKKISARQRKKIISEVEAKQRDRIEELKEEAAHREGAQFACSQSAVSESDPTWLNSLDVIIPSFNISAMDKTLFKDSALQIIHGRKYGLVGPNGAGKSTLLKMIASKSLRIPPRIDCLYVEQEVVADETPAVQAVMKADKERWDLLQEERRLDRALTSNPDDDLLNERLLSVHERLAELGADVAESKARRILHGLGFDEDMQVKPTRHFSGGWRMRISLARALFMEPTLLMLDEPTNHLDLNAVIWLDDYLQHWKKTLLVVSHDQDFLNSVCEEILHLEDQHVQPYKGNYDTFKDMEALRRAAAIKEWEKQQKKLTALKKSGSSKNKAEDMVKKVRSREPGAGKKKKTDAIASGQAGTDEVTLAKRPREYVVTLHFSPVSRLAPPVIEVRDVMFRYSPTAPVIFSGVDFGIDMDSRVCIVGPNGAGKTTLLKLLTGDLEPTEGEIRRNPRLRAGIYNQHFVDRLPMDIDPVAYLRSKFPETTDYQIARNLLGKFGLEGHAHTIKMRDLSGGQKARVVFCDLQLAAPHILFLDEPTNNLDIESIDALCLAIREFDGGVVVVTHDARLIESTDCRLWIVDHGAVTPWQDNFSNYKAHLLKELEEKVQEQERRRAAHYAARMSVLSKS